MPSSSLETKRNKCLVSHILAGTGVIKCLEFCYINRLKIISILVLCCISWSKSLGTVSNCIHLQLLPPAPTPAKLPVCNYSLYCWISSPFCNCLLEYFLKYEINLQFSVSNKCLFVFWLGGIFSITELKLFKNQIYLSFLSWLLGCVIFVFKLFPGWRFCCLTSENLYQ